MPIERREGFRLWVDGPVPRGADALTIGRFIMVRRGHEASEKLMRHEQVHVRQWRRYGYVGFSARYIGSYLLWRSRLKGHKGAYWRIPMEIEAEWIARRSLDTAVRETDQAQPASH